MLLDQLPVDPIYRIISFLSPVEIKVFFKVFPKLKHLQENAYFWKIITLLRWGEDNPKVWQLVHLKYYHEDIRAIIQAARENNLSGIRKLLSTGLSVNVTNERGNTPLITAVHQNNIAAVELLLENGAFPNQTDFFGKTPLLYATYYHQIKIIRLLLDYGAEINQLGLVEGTPLTIACQKDETHLINYLLDRGANPNLHSPGTEPLFISILNQNQTAVVSLIRTGANVNYVDQIGMTPLLLAEKVKNNRIYRLLLKAGAIEKETPTKWKRFRRLFT